MAMLQREALIVRKPGIGTFAVQPDSRVKFRGTMESFRETALSASKRYVTTVLDSQAVPTPRFIGDQFADLRCRKPQRAAALGAGGVHHGTA